MTEELTLEDLDNFFHPVIEHAKDSGICFRCRKRIAEYPKHERTMCIECFLHMYLYRLEDLRRNGFLDAREIITSSPEKIQDNKIKARKWLDDIRRNKRKFAEMLDRRFYGN